MNMTVIIVILLWKNAKILPTPAIEPAPRSVQQARQQIYECYQILKHPYDLAVHNA